MPHNRDDAGHFQKGHSGNPGGRPLVARDVREVQKLTAERHIRIVSKLLQRTPGELIEMAQDPYVTTQELLVAAVILRGIQKGDPVIYETIMDRVIGRVITQIQAAGTGPKKFTVEIKHADSKDVPLSDETIHELKIIG